MLHRLLNQVRNNAVAYTALFVALSGTAFAAGSAVQKNSVGTAQLKNRAVTGQKVALHTLTGANIKSSTLGTVPNAAHLGHLAPAAFERAITGTCGKGSAVHAVAKTGKVICGSAGTITGVTAATGLTGGGTSGNVTLAVDPTVVQARVTGSCGAGRAMSFINEQGTIVCHTTDETQMMGGTGAATLSTTSAFLAPVGISAPTTTLQNAEIGSADAPSTARHLLVRVATAPGTGNSWTFNFWVNGHQKTSVSCVISGTAQSCHTNGTVPVPRGAMVALHERGTGVTTGTTATFGWIDNTY
jgi:hypothetical protein